MTILSLVIPTYQPRPDHFIDMVQSLIGFGQSIELVVVNDAPGDAFVPLILAQYEANFPHCIYLENPRNLGIFRSYSIGMAKATSPYCAILDHDDIAHLSELLSFLKKAPAQDIVYTQEYKFSKDGGDRDKYEKPDFDSLSISYYFYTHHFTVYRTEIIHRLLDASSASQFTSGFDFWIMARYLSEVGPMPIVTYLKTMAYGWRVHSGSSALNIDHKPHHIADRVSSIDTFFSRHGDYGTYVIDNQRRYLVRSKFLSAFDILSKQADSTGLEAHIRALLAPRQGHQGATIRWIGIPDRDAIKRGLAILDRLPLHYILKATKGTALVPLMPLNILDDRRRQHPHGVPMIAWTTLASMRSENLTGFLITEHSDARLNHINTATIVFGE